LAGKEGETNNLFLNDSIVWFKVDVPLHLIISPYNHFRELIQFQDYSLNPFQIVELMKQKNLDILKDFEKLKLETIKEKLPVFAVTENGVILVHDGWFRTLVLASKGEQKIETYLALPK